MGQTITRSRAWSAVLVIGAALLELYFLPEQWLFRLVVAVLALSGAILGGLALWGGSGKVREIVVPERIPPAPQAPPPRDPVRERPPVHIPGGPAPPRFGRGSKAQALPWLLPAHAVYPGIAADEAQLGDLAVRAASVVGPGHRCEEPVVPRQDAYRLGRDDDGRYLIAAVADGVSSSRSAELGATVAVSAAITMLRDRLNTAPDLETLAATEIFSGVAAQMTDTATSRNLRGSDVCAALVIAVIPAHPVPGEREMWVAWVGDASVWTLRDGVWSFAAGDDKRTTDGVESNALAHVLPDNPLTVTSRRFQLRTGDVVALMTDGVGDALATLGEANGYFARKWAAPPSATSFADDVGYDAERFIDDRTAVAVWVGTREER
ncbi:Serine/threonine protein phosphatase PrpC [Saccharopolyspora antimicrobica]|uniref:Serine/threonine protein phosphatase PrpC n=1 Tax=Saccharopolyspora antimicrobica TaxID=455193 RepID=A0A1I4RYZ4_9PSEU|nr:protein phosphatase 2C domain-containing protein [Saccharopolyspora antimicrobica]RKT89205.1 serine/threonine protein phosphatase PrpC [Saccharopolyspora antimicrobica]SFM57512.1 Serine/threonine protein phosphatase PrpC [Saccharopolyspora antimicrobica]